MFYIYEYILDKKVVSIKKVQMLIYPRYYGIKIFRRVYKIKCKFDTKS